MCSGKIAVLYLLVPHKTKGEFMCPGKISVLSLLLSFQNTWTHPLFCVGLVEKELLSFQNTWTYPVLCGTSRERTAIFPEYMNFSPTQNRGWVHVFWKDSSSFSTSPTQNRGWVHVFWKDNSSFSTSPTQHGVSSWQMNSTSVLCGTIVEKELLSFQNTCTHPLFCVGSSYILMYDVNKKSMKILKGGNP
jgi:hypothetical protein